LKTLVLGLGNPILSDDSVGFRVVQELKARFNKPNLTLVESSASGLSLLDLITGYDKLIIVDAIKTEGGEAGKIYRLGAENLGAIRHSASPHDINLATALELGRKLGVALPQQITILAIEVVDVTTFSEKCTPEVDRAIPLAVSMVAEELDSG
jgi:hydrogenase maturation protease